MSTVRSITPQQPVPQKILDSCGFAGMLRHRVLRGTKRERELLSGRSEVRILYRVPKAVSATRRGRFLHFRLRTSDLYFNPRAQRRRRCGGSNPLVGAIVGDLSARLEKSRPFTGLLFPHLCSGSPPLKPGPALPGSGFVFGGDGFYCCQKKNSSDTLMFVCFHAIIRSILSRNTQQPITLEMNADRQSNPSDLAVLGHLPLHKGGFTITIHWRTA